MADLRRVDLFVEDDAHERFVAALLRRLAAERGASVHTRVVSGKGGHGRAIAELRGFQAALKTQVGVPDLVVVVIDGNCTGWTQRHAEVAGIVDRTRFPNYVIGCPDPHIERWYIADPSSLLSSLGARLSVPVAKCERGYYKHILSSALAAAGHKVLLGGAEFADEIVGSMDLFRAGKNDSAFKAFSAGLRRVIRTWR